MELRAADAGSIVALSVDTVAVVRASLHGAVEVGPTGAAHASVVDTLTTRQAVVGAGWN
jgi:hypothetical protein